MFRLFTWLVLFVWFAVPLLWVSQPANSLGEWWFAADPASLNLLQSFIQRFVSANLWTEYAVPILRRPPWYGAMLLAMIMMIPWFFVRLLRNLRAD